MAIIISGTTGIDAGSLPVANTGKISAGAGLPVILNTAGVDRVIVNTAGNVGIGTSVPEERLDVRLPAFTGQNQTHRILIQSLSNSTANTLGSKMGITFNGRNSTFNTSGGVSTASIYAVNEDNDIYSRNLGLAFYTSTLDSVEIERMRIDSAGNVGIATAGYTGFGKIGVAGQIGMNCSNAQALSARGLQFFIDGNKHGNLSVDNYDNLLYIGNGIGYGTGAGGQVTQLTSKSTAVTLNKPTGLIIMNNAALAAGAIVEFNLNNSLLSGSDTLVVSGGTYSYNYMTQVKTVSSSIAVIRVTNVTGGTLSEPLAISFTVLKGAAA